MRRCLFLAAVLLASAMGPALGASAQTDARTVEIDLTFTLHPDEGSVEVELVVEDPGSLATLHLALGRLANEGRLEGEPTLEGSWSQDGDKAVADLEETPNARASWTADARIRVQSLEGEGHTSYVGDAFAVVKAGDVMPAVEYTFPQGEPPVFSTILQVDAPDGWRVDGPWRSSAPGAFAIDGVIPRGFLAADDDLEDERLGDDGTRYHIVRVEGAKSHEAMEDVLLQAAEFLPGLYGRTVHQRFVVVAPDPMFRGGLGSPDGIFLHADADGSVIAHEMVHAFQGWQFSRAPGEATIWLAEGAAVVHGTLLEVATGLKTREEAVEHLQGEAETAREKHGVALTSAVYGSENERAAYTKGAVVVTALDDAIREATSNEYTLADVLKRVNQRSAADDAGRLTLTTAEFVDVIANVTAFDLSPFFQRFVYGEDVPPLGSVFPGQASIRVLGTVPDPPVADQPLAIRVQVTNLDTDELKLEEPVLVNGTQAGTLRATLAAGSSAVARANLSELSRGTYELQVQDSVLETKVLGPPDPSVEITLWPRDPGPGENVTVGARIANDGEAPFRGPVTLSVDGRAVAVQEVPVRSGEARTVTRTLAPLGPGDHSIEATAPNGSVLAEQTVTVREAEPERASPGPGLLAALAITIATGWLARARRQS